NTATSKPPSGYSGPIPPPPTDAAVAKSHGDAAPPTVVDLPPQTCTGKTDVCRIMADFAKGTTPIDLPASGQDLWAGCVWGGTSPWFVPDGLVFDGEGDERLDRASNRSIAGACLSSIVRNPPSRRSLQRRKTDQARQARCAALGGRIVEGEMKRVLAFVFAPL